ncbi:Dymeclin [Fasciola gigantica]|uniref:Dymeclin n=1 Tax=Fasciola gigantica TaxID=46835 RepID=A0A504YI21_FASGI|nr:Dymeclin [Fasciola gigantica]
MEASSEQAFLKHLSDDPNEVTECPLLANFFHTIFLLLVRIPVNSETYALHCEILTTALVLFAGQMRRPLASPLPLIFAYAIWGKCAHLAPAVVHRLLTNFSENLPTPPGLMGRPAQSSFMWRAASSLAGGLLTVVTLGYANRGSSSTTATQRSDQSEQDPNKSNTTPSTDLITSESVNRTGQGCNVLAEQSTLLLLVLTTQAGSISRCAHLPQELGLEAETPTLNPYRLALFSLRDNKQNKPHASRHNANVSEPSAKADFASPVPKSQTVPMLRGIVSTENPELDAFPVDFTALRDIAAQTMHQDSSTLLLYLLVHRNTHFQEFLLQNQNYEKLLLPLLNVLYRSPADSTHLVYMALIIILILTENEKFGQEIHTSLINWVDWSPSRRLTSISRGSLIILVLIRTIRYHLNQLKDKYLHVNILAALANLSAKVKNLHPHVSDSFLCLLQLLTKRYNRTVEQLQNLSAKSTDAIDDEVSVDVPIDKANTTAPTTNTVANTNAKDENEKNSTEESVIQELSLLEEVIRMILEILNSILTHVLLDNSNLIYSLLYQRECLVALRSHPSFQNVIQNLDTILSFFSKKIEQEVGENPSSPEQLLAVINRHSPNVYRNCNLRKFPDLKFKYVEEESPDDFFIPYVWSVVLRQSGIAFRADQLRLFSPESESAVSDGKAGDVDPDVDADNENELSTGTPTTTTVATASTSATMRTEKAIGGVAV